MKKTIFTGAGVAIVTPFNPDMSVNYEKLGELIDWQIANKTDAIVICGTTGESSALSLEEHEEVVKYAIDHVAGRVPVVASSGSNDTAAAVQLSKSAKEAGADGLLMVTPYYNKTTQVGIVKHYEKVASEVDLPIIVYNVPSRTGFGIKPETYVELAKIPTVTAVKEANGDISAIAKTIALCGDSLDIYSGNDDMIVPMMSLGAKGVISVLSNVMPKETHDICQLFFDGKYKESADLQLKLIHMCDALFCEVNPMPVKAAMNMMGLDVGIPRLPLCDVTDASKEKIKAALLKEGLIK
ncbi:MAG: 4-hydroxy-tetrahydrodipicolinate synthase [Clostridia bacterium]|nr:4-hydroxy-tetrahydrodipicolinate synthase [Clostridia bacterium]